MELTALKNNQQPRPQCCAMCGVHDDKPPTKGRVWCCPKCIDNLDEHKRFRVQSWCAVCNRRWDSIVEERPFCDWPIQVDPDGTPLYVKRTACDECVLKPLCASCKEPVIAAPGDPRTATALSDIALPTESMPWVLEWGDWAMTGIESDKRWWHNACAPRHAIEFMRTLWHQCLPPDPEQELAEERQLQALLLSIGEDDQES